MTADGIRYSYGPVPSRRLGRSLGINNIPPKVCSYACIYCQAGRTVRHENSRSAFYVPEDIFDDLKNRVQRARNRTEKIDYLAFVPDGEPTLDLNIGKEIILLKRLGVPIGVITNSSLLWRNDVREELCRADWVSVKVDTVDEVLWKKINKPCKGINFDQMLEGIAAFAGVYSGRLVTETMLLKGINDNDRCMNETADFIRQLDPDTAYLSVPIRPTQEKNAHMPEECTLNRMYNLLSEKVPVVECLAGYEGNAFAFTGNVEKDLLSVTAVHPMRREAVEDLLARAGASWDVVGMMMASGQLVKTDYNGHEFYLRRFGNHCI
ncbi:MAG: radical SAM protein [Dissulfurispiraceae bacterium]|jgi:wyosine [tRNA(Phe)-imidazoG37] synthetase (radical SAM superfamily)|nr:radical SAM protein [Dissulfurispiraceae bacterium]